MVESDAGRVLLLTGRSGVGKSTVLARVADALGDRVVRGFSSEEIRVAGRREGFRLDGFGGGRAVLAHVGIDSPHRLGRYGIDVDALEHITAAELDPGLRADLFLIDEIGKMECFSPRFVAAMRALLDSRRCVVATVHQTAGGFVRDVRERPDAELWELTLANRDAMPDRVLAWIASRGGANERSS